MRAVAAALCLATFCATAAGDIINVPADFPTIQAAINAATNGDEIIVAPGRYSAIDLLGKGITVRSTDPVDPAVVAATIIDGSGIGTVIRCDTGEPAETIIDGFTVTGGVGNSGPGGTGGGGMYIANGSAPFVHRLVFVGNTANAGGGLYFTGNSTITIQSCTFLNNYSAELGGGVYNGDVATSSAVITQCTFTGNAAYVGGAC